MFGYKLVKEAEYVYREKQIKAQFIEIRKLREQIQAQFIEIRKLRDVLLKLRDMLLKSGVSSSTILEIYEESHRKDKDKLCDCDEGCEWDCSHAHIFDDFDWSDNR